MNTKKLAEIHEKLGDDYLDVMRQKGIDFPPPVAWSTGLGRETYAVIFLDDFEDEVRGFPVDMLAQAVASRAMVHCTAGVGRN